MLVITLLIKFLLLLLARHLLLEAMPFATSSDALAPSDPRFGCIDGRAVGDPRRIASARSVLKLPVVNAQ